MKKTTIITILFFLGLSLFSCSKEDNTISFFLINNSDVQVEFYLPYKKPRWHSWPPTGDMHNLDKEDSTLHIAGGIFAYPSQMPGTSSSFPTAYTSVNEMSDYDLVRVWVVDASYYFWDDVGAAHKERERIRREDDYLVRYDFTLSDLKTLMNENREIVICYPPDSTMKDIKMWPPYVSFMED